MKSYTGKTAADRRNELQKLGVIREAADFIIRLEAEDRHNDRIHYILESALSYAVEVGCASSTTSPEAMIAATALIDAEIAGVGGRLGFTGDSTARHPAFQGCGKGRKKATDGKAWDAAISAALGRTGYEVEWRVMEGVLYARCQTRHPMPIAGVFLPPQWLLVTVKRGLEASLHEGHSGHGRPCFVGEPHEWAELLNSLLDPPQEVVVEGVTFYE
ncbi:MAG: hypothetical protein KBD55_00885 [Candidatus Pacebacteria bacterium]|nr:hypothetical protein [Candidatus Paceibacterota bacterium]